MRKENSTNSINKQFLFEVCELNSALATISGRWKSQIIYSIFYGNNRFHLLKKQLPNISEQVLARQLKELETEEMIIKKEIPSTIPLGIKYILTQKSQDLIPILNILCDWGKIYTKEKSIVKK